MKRTLALLLATLMIFGSVAILASCGKPTETTTENTTAAPPTSNTTDTTEEPTPPPTTDGTTPIPPSVVDLEDPKANFKLSVTQSGDAPWGPVLSISCKILPNDDPTDLGTILFNELFDKDAAPLPRYMQAPLKDTYSWILEVDGVEADITSQMMTAKYTGTSAGGMNGYDKLDIALLDVELKALFDQSNEGFTVDVRKDFTNTISLYLRNEYDQNVYQLKDKTLTCKAKTYVFDTARAASTTLKYYDLSKITGIQGKDSSEDGGKVDGEGYKKLFDGFPQTKMFVGGGSGVIKEIVDNPSPDDLNNLTDYTFEKIASDDPNYSDGHNYYYKTHKNPDRVYDKENKDLIFKTEESIVMKGISFFTGGDSKSYGRLPGMTMIYGCTDENGSGATLLYTIGMNRWVKNDKGLYEEQPYEGEAVDAVFPSNGKFKEDSQYKNIQEFYFDMPNNTQSFQYYKIVFVGSVEEAPKLSTTVLDSTTYHGQMQFSAIMPSVAK